MNFNVTGKIVKAFEKKSGVSQAGKEWASQDYLLQEKDGENVLFFNVFGEENISNYNLHEDAEVSLVLEVRSREWNGRYYTELRCKQCYSLPHRTSVNDAPAKKVEEAPF